MVEHCVSSAKVVGARGAVEVRCLAQGSHLSHGQLQPEPRFEPTTSGYKSNALSTRPRLPPSIALCNVLLSIATNIPVLLMTAFVLQGHIFTLKSCILYIML